MNLILTPEKWWPVLSMMLDGVGFARDVSEIVPCERLIGFWTGVIVPAEHLGNAYNIHPGPPEYPGRDPIHWALRDGVEMYGVTFHKMVESVDAGDILWVERFGIRGMDHAAIDKKAKQVSLKMLGEICSWRWGKKHSRADMLALPRVERERIGFK